INAYLSFVLNNIGQLHEYWRTKLNRNQMPVWADIDTIDIPKPSPHVALMEVCWNPRRFLWRLIETNITTALGYDSTGFYFDER
ncbi:MAG: hypothetical protein VX955_02170, partial [Pseudomonadota bacterium]|nr:hypothetical protein [Pseudomonadota bacterium]